MPRCPTAPTTHRPIAPTYNTPHEPVVLGCHGAASTPWSGISPLAVRNAYHHVVDHAPSGCMQPPVCTHRACAYRDAHYGFSQSS
jgi:hypothetical protein